MKCTALFYPSLDVLYFKRISPTKSYDIQHFGVSFEVCRNIPKINCRISISWRNVDGHRLHHLSKTPPLPSSYRIDSYFDADFAEMGTARLVTKRIDQVL